jgi:hypothetical protein
MAIELAPLCTLTLEVAGPMALGATPTGDRSVSEIRNAVITGDRLKGEMAGSAAADWMIRTGDLATVDVRITIRTHDGALILMHYTGRLDLSSPATGFTAYVAPLFETGDERYRWLSRIQAVGKGRVKAGPSGTTLEYEICEVR